MGKYKLTPLGGWSGRVGSVKFSSWNGINVVSSMPSSYSDANSVAQQPVRQRAIGINKLLKGLVAVIRIGFKGKAVKMSEYNRAQQLNAGAHSGANGLAGCDFPQIKLSEGSVQAAGAVVSGQGNTASKISITIANNADGITGFATDVCHGAVCLADGSLAQPLIDLGTRVEMAAGVERDLGSAYVGESGFLYLFFSRADGSDQSPTTAKAFDIS